MTFEYRSAQRRIYIPDAAYFITVKTLHNEPYFREPILCDLFVENLRVCKRLKGFELYGWFLGYDHFHLLLKPGDQFNYSKIMKSLKENVSCSINRVVGYTEGATTSSRLQWVYGDKYDLLESKKQFSEKYPNRHPFSKFYWQKSFRDHYIRGETDLRIHLEYIVYNPTKHGLPTGWPYLFTNEKYVDLLDDWR